MRPRGLCALPGINGSPLERDFCEGAGRTLRYKQTCLQVIKFLCSLIIKELQSDKLRFLRQKRAPPNGCFTALKNDRKSLVVSEMPGNAFPGISDAQRRERRGSRGGTPKRGGGAFPGHYSHPWAAFHVDGILAGGKKTGTRNAAIRPTTTEKSAGAVTVLFLRRNAAH